MSAALRCLISEYLEGSGCLCKEVCRCFDNEPSRMPLPGSSDCYIDFSGLLSRLNPQGIALIVSAVNRRRSKMDDRVIATELLVLACANGGQEIRHLTWPIGGAIDCPAIA